ncbi:MAG TPA: discoidin domain-containing protein [Candidatus Kryptonia bacterium]
MNAIFTRLFIKMNPAILLLALPIMIGFTSEPVRSQSRTHYANKEIFLSGINIAWVNYANDLGASPDLTQFATEFKTVHDNGGNVLKFWMHVDGVQTPVYNDTGLVTGPGQYMIQDLKQILSLASQYSVGIMMTLWSHDLLSTDELDSAQLYRNAKLFTDTAYTMAYIRNALIPMVDSLKGNPAIQSWNIVIEPEGFSDVLGWGNRVHVPIADIQRFVNLIAGAIHRTDTSALVTLDANTMQSNTDVQSPAGTIQGQFNVSSLSPQQVSQYTNEFNILHRTNMTTADWVAYMQKISLAGNTNYYTDARLKAAGGDSDGTLDFYTVDYYSGAGTSYSPFLHNCSAYMLDKPLVIGEFFMAPTDGLADGVLYPRLYNNGYAGALMWAWAEDQTKTSLTDTWSALQYMFANYRNDIIVFPKTGSIYVFSATPGTIQKTDSTVIRWDAEPGSTVTFNGLSESSVKDSVIVSPLVTTSYTLTASGMVNDTSRLTVTVLPTGRIMSFKATPLQIGTGESTSLVWQVVKNSTATLNNATVPVVDSIVVYPDVVNNTYTLLTEGDEHDSTTISIQVLPPDQVDRAYQGTVTASSNDTVTYTFSNPQNIVDGNNFTRWQASASPTAQWVRIDMGNLFAVTQVTIRWGNHAYAKSYSLQLAPDNVNWIVVKSQSNGTGGTNYVETVSGLQDTARYLALLLLSQGTNGAYSIAEIMVQGTLATGVRSTNDLLPKTYSLSQNFPNPFNPSTRIRFALPNAGDVTLTVYDVLGREVETLLHQRMSPGNYELDFDASRLSSGVYFYSLRAGSYFVTKKMLLLK